LRYLLDTNVVSELRKIGDGKADANVVAWVGAEDAARFFISAITTLELERGVLGVQRRDATQGARLRSCSTVVCARNSPAASCRLTMRLRHVARTYTSPTGATRPTR
jgi:predicted nucleic acid-binding protein